MNVSQAQQTPLMKQYWSIKSLHPDKILFFRMGDFYEIFHEDALTAAPLLGITLTCRNKNVSDPTPMCGVPHHSIAKPINTLLSLGHRVAICDQLEDPKFAKGIVKRGVTRVLSPGVVYDSGTLDAHKPHFLTAYSTKIISFLDITTGDAFYYETSFSSERDHLISLLNPVEMILTQEQKDQGHKFQNLTCTVHEPLSSHIHASGILSNDRLLSYVVSMQGEKTLLTIRPFEKRFFSQKMKISSLTREHLELFSTYKGEKKGSLFHCINKAKSPLGARRLHNWMTFPLTSHKHILKRQGEVQRWKESPYLTDVRKALSFIGDLERKIGRISISNCHPRELLQLAESLSWSLKALFLANNNNQSNIATLKSLISTTQSIKDKIQKTLKSQVPLQIKDGNFIKKNVCPQLDELIMFIENAHTQILAIEARERQNLNIPNLKIRHNNVFGYYIEVTNTHKNKVPPSYIRKQTLVNAERYITEELQNLEARILSAKVKSSQIEREIFNKLRIEILNASNDLLFLSDQISQIDVFASLAWLALENNYVCPEISDNDICLVSSRHPVVEAQMDSSIFEFVPNDIFMKRSECFLITGPNMAGKSTLMRQVALNAIMMQMGCFLPAAKAKLPLFDQIQTRIGASDILAEGLSTFMLEMKETAQILKESTNQTLIILDEIGRGTSTFDGMSLAQAILEYLVSHVQATTFFATHYHELAQMKDQYPQIINKHMKILEDKDKEQITFLYQLVDGFASRSYGIHVAKLAGLPATVIQKAQQLLQIHHKSTLSNCRKDRLTNNFESNTALPHAFQTQSNQLDLGSSRTIN